MTFGLEPTLKQAEVDIAALKERYLRVGVSDRGKRYNTELLEAVELGFLLDLAECLVVSAKARNESRGGHFREDYPTRDDVNFMRHTMAYKVPDASGATTFQSDVRLDYKFSDTSSVFARYSLSKRHFDEPAPGNVFMGANNADNTNYNGVVGYTQAYERHQSPLIVREALLVAFFLAGLVVPSAYCSQPASQPL